MASTLWSGGLSLGGRGTWAGSTIRSAGYQALESLSGSSSSTWLSQMGLVSTLSITPGSPNTTAYQRFLPSGPIAVLPLGPATSSLVGSDLLVTFTIFLLLPIDPTTSPANSYCSYFYFLLLLLLLLLPLQTVFTRYGRLESRTFLPFWPCLRSPL